MNAEDSQMLTTICLQLESLFLDLTVQRVAFWTAVGEAFRENRGKEYSWLALNQKMKRMAKEREIYLEIMPPSGRRRAIDDADEQAGNLDRWLALINERERQVKDARDRGKDLPDHVKDALSDRKRLVAEEALVISSDDEMSVESAEAQSPASREPSFPRQATSEDPGGSGQSSWERQLTSPLPFRTAGEAPERGEPSWAAPTPRAISDMPPPPQRLPAAHADSETPFSWTPTAWGTPSQSPRASSFPQSGGDDTASDVPRRGGVRVSIESNETGQQAVRRGRGSTRARGRPPTQRDSGSSERPSETERRRNANGLGRGGVNDLLKGVIDGLEGGTRMLADAIREASVGGATPGVVEDLRSTVSELQRDH